MIIYKDKKGVIWSIFIYCVVGIWITYKTDLKSFN